MARPTKYSEDLADQICERIANGESMRSVSRDEAMPAMSTLFKWLREHDQFSEQYARAKDESADCMVDDILSIADNDEEDPQSRRVRIDARKWVASKLKPKKYGDRIQTEVTGRDGGPIEVAWEVQPVSSQATNSDT